MLAAERRARIVSAIRRQGTVRVTELAELFDVSEMTIRRDLDELDHGGAVVKVHGGATLPAAASSDEPGFDAKAQRQRAEKVAIAAAAVRLLEPGGTIGLSAGTTTFALAQAMADLRDLTVVTNSMRIAGVLHAQPEAGHTVVLTGGVRTQSDALVGPLAVTALEGLHLDVVFLGVHGIDVRAGFTTPNLLEAETDRALTAAGRRLVVLADHTKWATIGLSTIAPLDRADVLVTDAGLDPGAAHTLSDHVGELVLAAAPETDGVR